MVAVRYRCLAEPPWLNGPMFHSPGQRPADRRGERRSVMGRASWPTSPKLQVRPDGATKTSLLWRPVVGSAYGFHIFVQQLQCESAG